MRPRLCRVTSPNMTTARQSLRLLFQWKAFRGPSALLRGPYRVSGRLGSSLGSGAGKSHQRMVHYGSGLAIARLCSHQTPSQHIRTVLLICILKSSSAILCTLVWRSAWSTRFGISHHLESLILKHRRFPPPLIPRCPLIPEPCATDLSQVRPSQAPFSSPRPCASRDYLVGS